MKSTVIERRQVIEFYLLTVQSPVSTNIYLNFTPDEMIIRSVIYYSTYNETAVEPTRTYCDFVENSSQPICSFYNPVNYSPNSHFTLIKPLQGVLTFSFIDLANEAELGRAGVLVLHCEFVKYEDKKQVKIY